MEGLTFTTETEKTLRSQDSEPPLSPGFTADDSQGEKKGRVALTRIDALWFIHLFILTQLIIAEDVAVSTVCLLVLSIYI